MHKGPYVIAGIGLAGCVTLAWIAQHLQPHAKRGAAAGPRGVATSFADRLAGPLATHDEHEGDAVRRVFVGRAARGEDLATLARAIAEDARRRAVATGGPCAIRVTLRPADGDEPCTVELPFAVPAAPGASR